jgi:Mg2+ and Co2+ transporter CorA
VSRHELIRAMQAEKELELCQRERSELMAANSYLQTKHMEAVQELHLLKKDFVALTAAMAGAASAYRRYAKRAGHIRPKAHVDPFFTTRADDMDTAVARAQTVLGGEPDGIA